MVTKMKSRVHILGLLAILLILGFDCPQLSAGMIKKETRQVNGAKYIINNTTAKIVFSQGSKDEAIIETEEQFLKSVQLNVSGNKLTIETENTNKFPKHLVVYITLKELKGVKIKGAGDLITTGQVKTSDFTLMIEGAGDANLTNIIGEKVTVAIFGSGDIVVAGECKVFNSEIAGSGDVNAIRMRTKEANVKITGCGDCSVDPSDAVYVKITGSGDVILKNEPKTIKTSISGSGDIRRY